MAGHFEVERAEIARRIKAAGNTFSEETIATFAPLFAKFHARRDEAAREPVKIQRDLAYGPHRERNLLDVHVTAGGGSAKPIVIFFHGGGLVRGNKDGGGPYYGNIASFFARHGAVGINATYRLAPEIQWPEGARDVGAVAAWAREHAAEFGGDPDKIVLTGHSAGATHVASYVFRPDLHPGGKRNFAAAILMSGVYGIDMDNPPPNHRAYYGTDRARYPGMQVTGNAACFDFPMLFTVAEYDPLRFESGLYRLLAELVDKGAPNPRIRQFLGHNHISPALTIGTGEEDVENPLLDFLKTI